MKLFHRDAGARAADAGGNGQHGKPVVFAHKAAVFAVERKRADVCKERGDAVEPRGIARQERTACAHGFIQADVRL